MRCTLVQGDSGSQKEHNFMISAATLPREHKLHDLE